MAYKNPNDPRARKSRREHYYKNKKQYLERNKKARKERRQWLNRIKAVPCQDCGLIYPYYVMDFDHRDPTRKLAPVSKLITWSWKKLKEEVVKCDLVCSNCHRERTYQRAYGRRRVSKTRVSTRFDS